MSKPTIVAIIGSSRFKPFHLGAMQRETLKGKIVLPTGLWHHVDLVPLSDSYKNVIDALSRAKIDLADEVYVVNVHGYVGETTKELITYATNRGKPITSLEPL